jgi:hypothetical protein
LDVRDSGASVIARSLNPKISANRGIVVAGDIMTFSFTKLAIRSASTDKYAVCTVPTNLANWGQNDLVGNLAAVNIGEAEVGFYFTRVDPLSLYPNGQMVERDENGFYELTIDQRTQLTIALEASKVFYVPGSTALLGMITDWVPFEDMNWLTIITAGADHDLNAYVALTEQRLPKVRA